MLIAYSNISRLPRSPSGRGPYHPHPKICWSRPPQPSRIHACVCVSPCSLIAAPHKLNSNSDHANYVGLQYYRSPVGLQAQKLCIRLSVGYITSRDYWSASIETEFQVILMLLVGPYVFHGPTAVV